jgi:predicted O-methyltransferase YrrM
VFLPGQKLRVNITDNSFDSPIPDLRELKDDLWLTRSELVGIDIREQDQLSLLSHFESEFKSEYELFPRDMSAKPFEYYVNNPMFGSVDGEIMYCMIRHFKPRTIIEVGSGYSTYLMAQAILKNKEENEIYNCNLTAIEPYPSDTLKAGLPGLSKLIDQKVQSVSVSEFGKLSDSDILFIDSSHVLKIGSDVPHEYLDILPRLQKGVIIHIHDIFLPAQYPKEWLFDYRRFWTEQYLLHAFLLFNDSFEVLWAGHYMYLNNPETLERAFKSYSTDECWPCLPISSFWIKKIK